MYRLDQVQTLRSPASESTKGNYEFYVFIAAWLGLNIFSSFYTELSYDEAYYWMYSRFLDWGYFDHPPMVALMDAIGDSIFHHELGVRMMTLLFSTLTIIILAALSGFKNSRVLFLIVLSSLPFHLFGFISVPDVPLLFFTAVFFYIYNKFLEDNRWLTVLLLAITMAALMYSKYHGIIIILCTLISYPRLLLNKKFLVAAVFSILLYVPHLYWQYTNDFVSIKFHFFGRSGSGYKFNNTLEYILSQPFYYGPVAGIFLLYFAFTSKPENTFERALQYTVWGIFGFFLLSTLKGSVEANWTLPALVPMTYFTVKSIKEYTRIYRWLKLSTLVVLPAFIAVRVLLAFAPEAYVERMGEFVGWRNYTTEVMSRAADRPLIATSYQDAAKLSFYSGTIVPSLNLNGRHNQFDLWNLAYPYEGKRVVLLNRYMHRGDSMLNPKMEKVFLTKVNKLPVYQGLQISPLTAYKARRGQAVIIDAVIHSLTGGFPGFLTPVHIEYKFFEKGKSTVVKDGYTVFNNSQIIGEDYYGEIPLDVPLKKGKYILKMNFVSRYGGWKEWSGKEFEVK